MLQGSRGPYESDVHHADIYSGRYHPLRCAVELGLFGMLMIGHRSFRRIALGIPHTSQYPAL